ncbi:para-aminobenzoate synthase [Ascobolus immersus RN42]|uniref:aminodeoxychorismate synthase n=1 Tax=Ascobolus immersus RN42 TaxID=1160509 RepID=A0A3N4HUF2_ASCIM|nr:para-aminobenzoate synthase [Ascobolus immersus RN42]
MDFSTYSEPQPVHKAPPNSRRILFIDSYDSFTYNLTTLLESITGAEVHVIHNDTLLFPELLPHIDSFDAVVVGPGPGSPEIPEDVGVIRHLWNELPENKILPILGVCLGHQSLCLSAGGKLKRLNVVKHGMITKLEHVGHDIFHKVGEVNAVRYHSLHVVDPYLDEVEPLAWADDGEENGKVLMAVRHRRKPFWGVQYHPESICTRGGGPEVLDNFWQLALDWSRSNGRKTKPLLSNWRIRPRMKTLLEGVAELGRKEEEVRNPVVVGKEVEYLVMENTNLDVPAIADLLGARTAEEFAVLDSASAPGRFSIIASFIPETTPKFHKVGSRAEAEKIPLEPYGSVWGFLAKTMNDNQITTGPTEIPFWGGLIGYFSYEVGVDALEVPLKHRSPTHSTPDISLVFVHRSIILDKQTSRLYILSIHPTDTAWLHTTYASLLATSSLPLTPAISTTTTPTPKPIIFPPARQTYESAITTCKTHLSAGSSYELCLTSLTPLPPPQDPYSTFLSLLHSNPAPYALYLRLAPTTILSSSPERFLSISRPPHQLTELRPIKGTLSKSPALTLPLATKRLQNDPKEVSENLMILDLIRHDLHQFSGAELTVPQLMKVEEYASVYQMVSVIRAPIPQAPLDEPARAITQADLLSKMLPPGSMTGAPKKRSVEILQDVEGHERGVYSGVMGYWDIGGGGDWAVVIRSAVGYDEGKEGTRWEIGAGGAITALSLEREEWEEMVVKLRSAGRVFGEVRS